jgi:hypothetical protein
MQELAGHVGRLAGALVLLLAVVVVSTGVLPPVGAVGCGGEASIGVERADGAPCGESERGDTEQRDDERDDDERDDDEDPLGDAALGFHRVLARPEAWSAGARRARGARTSEDRSLSAHTRTIERPPHA